MPPSAEEPGTSPKAGAAKGETGRPHGHSTEGTDPGRGAAHLRPGNATEGGVTGWGTSRTNAIQSP